MRSFEKEDGLLENSRISSCPVQLKSVLFNLLCVFELLLAFKLHSVEMVILRDKINLSLVRLKADNHCAANLLSFSVGYNNTLFVYTLYITCYRRWNLAVIGYTIDYTAYVLSATTTSVEQSANCSRIYCEAHAHAHT